MGLINGQYDAKEGGGFVPGGSSLHNAMSAHGPDTQTFKKAIDAAEGPNKIDNTMAFMFETCHKYQATPWAMDTKLRQKDYWKCWQGFEPLYKEES